MALFCAALVGFFAMLIEAGSFVLYRISQGQMFSYSALDRQRARIAEGHDTAEPRSWLGGELDYITIHPYFGFAYDTKATVTDDYLLKYKAVVNPFGMTGPSPLQKRSPNKLIVGIAGGSVAHGLVMEAQEYLQRKLPELPQYRGREVVVVALSMGGFKQPQPLLALTYFLCEGGEFDLLINLDGFNEIIGADQHVEAGVYPTFPAVWPGISGATPDREMMRRIGRLVDAQERRKTSASEFGAALLSRSVTAQLLWKLLDKRTEHEIDAARQVIQDFKRPNLTFREIGPGAAGWKGQHRFGLIAESWRRCSVNFDRLCRAHDIRYFHFLQPNQYLDLKPMDAAERAQAYDEKHPWRQLVVNGFPALQREAPELHQAGVRFRDLTPLFKDVREALYIDNCCHMGKRGNELMAQAIVDTIAEWAELESAKLQGILVEQSTVTIEDPLIPARARVIGKFADGKERPVSAAHAGSTYRSSSPEVVVVTEDGELRGIREGAATIAIANGPFTAQLSVTSQWRPVSSFGLGVPGTGEITPVLDTGNTEPRIGGTGFLLRVNEVRGGAAGVLAFSERVPERFPSLSIAAVPRDKLSAIQIQANGAKGQAGAGFVEIPFPIPNDPAMRGRTTYVQAVFEDAGAPGGHSCSNGLRLTVR